MAVRMVLARSRADSPPAIPSLASMEMVNRGPPDVPSSSTMRSRPSLSACFSVRDRQMSPRAFVIHKVDGFGSNSLGRRDQIALVFGLSVINQNHHPAAAYGLYRLFYCAKRHNIRRAFPKLFLEKALARQKFHGDRLFFLFLVVFGARNP